MSLLEIGAEAQTEIDAGESSGFGPDRALSLKDTDDVPLAPAASSLSDKEFILNKDGSVPTWSFAAERFKRRILSDSPYSPRFDHPWANRTRGRLLRADECMRKWAKTTVLLTYTGDPFLEGSSRPMPPMSFTTALTASRPARRRAMRDLFDATGGRWMTIRVVGAHESGYPHEHVLVGTESSISSEDLEPAIAAHRNESPVAGDGAHGVGAIRSKQSPNTEEPTGGVQYIATNVPGVSAVLEAEELGQTSNGVPDEEEHKIRTSAVLEATGTHAVGIDCSDGVEPTWY